VATDFDRQDDLIASELQQALDDLIAVYRVGSSVQGQARDGSDTDVAVLCRRPLTATIRFDLQERLAARLGHDVDLLDLWSASPVMAIQVVAAGQLIFDGEPDARGAFEDRVFSAYARLNEERREILERVRTEGTVYGR
jgi:predicted nucleotidyltransferase